jgi:hypothetical protein
MERWLVGGEAWFPLQLTGHGKIDLMLVDQEGTGSLEVTVAFPAMWLVNPGVAEPGNSFQTELRVAPAPGGTLGTANIQISFDPERVAYVQTRAMQGSGIHLATSPSVQDNRLTIEMSSEAEITAQDWPEGIPVCMVEWSCLGPGATCFDIEGSMSPSVDGWTLCMEQKSRRENIQCICVNVIYRTWRNEDRRTGRLMVNQALSIISGNTYLCCPILIYDWNISALNGAQWLQIMKLWGGKQEPSTEAEMAALLDADDLGQQEDCINLYALPIGDPSILGYSNIGPPGNMIITPVAYNTRRNTAAHEFGHALGLRHSRDRYNLMYEEVSTAHFLSKDQCETIWQTLGNYPCN